MIFEKKILELYSSILLRRMDNEQGVFYFSPEDFPGLQAHSYDFTAGAGHALCGYFYHYDNPIPGKLVIFDHGMGNGHRSYLREIEMLCRGGYLVYSYDHTGCMRSGGSNVGGFAQSLHDLDDCITALKREPALQGRSMAVMGHSWGGFSTMNIAKYHPELTHVVSMSGFTCVEQMLRQELRGILKPYIPAVLELERKNNPGYADSCAVACLKKTDAKVLLIYSGDDKTVRRKMHYDPLYQALSGRENIRFLLLKDKNHNPTYTPEAVVYKNAFWDTLQKKWKKGLLATKEAQAAFMARYDFLRMTCQDEKLWQIIYAHFGDRPYEADL